MFKYFVTENLLATFDFSKVRTFSFRVSCTMPRKTQRPTLTSLVICWDLVTVVLRSLLLQRLTSLHRATGLE